VVSAGRPEVDAVDTAVSVAVAVFSHVVNTEGNARDRLRAEALERMAINHLVARGYDRIEAKRMVQRRLHRADVEGLIAEVNDRSDDPQPTTH
jgi:hypothetical protein